MEGDEHFSLLRVADTLHITKQARPLRQKKLLVVMGVEVGRQRNHNGAAKSTVDVIRDYTLKHSAFEDAIQAAIVGIEVISRHRIASVICLAFGRGWCRRSCTVGCSSSQPLCGLR